MVDDRCHALQGAPACRGSQGRQSRDGKDKRGLNSKIHLAVDAHGMPVRFFVTAGTTADCSQAAALIEGISAQYLLADRGYDADYVVGKAREMGMKIVMPSKKNRIVSRDYDKYLYRMRHLVENTFLNLKRWRGIATRYAKTLASFVAFVQIRCIAIWLNVLA